MSVAQQCRLRFARGPAGEQPDGDLLGIRVAVGGRFGGGDLGQELVASDHGEASDVGDTLDGASLGDHQRGARRAATAANRSSARR